MPEKPMRRVRITFNLEEDPRVPWNERDIRKWLDDARDLLEGQDTVETIEFPDGKLGDPTDDELYS